MSHPSCPKCGAPGPIEDECPNCGVYVSKFLDVQRRRAALGPGGPGDAHAGLTGPLPPPDAAHAVHAGRAADAGRTRTIAVVVAAIAVLGGVGYVVLIDWFGPAFDYRVPAGWRPVEDETVERAMSGMCPAARDKTTMHAIYVRSDADADKTALAVMESDERFLSQEQGLGRLRDAFRQVETRMPGASLVRADSVSFGDRPGAEIHLDLKVGGASQSILLLVLDAGRSTFFAIAAAPSVVVREHLDALRHSMASLRSLPAGLRGSPWFKHSLRWTWVVAVVVAAMIGLGRIRAD